MLNQDKFNIMGFPNLPRGGKYKIFINETRYFDESKAKYIKHLINLSEWNPEHVYHSADSCLAVQEVFDYLGAEVEIYYSNMSVMDAVAYCKANGINVIARSATFSFEAWRDNERKAMEEFNAGGGIFVAAAGNDRSRDNSPTAVDNDYFISVGCVNYPDNSNSTIVVLSGLRLQEFTPGIDNIYTDTSGAVYGAAAVAVIMSSCYKYHFEKYRSWIIENAKTDYPGLEEGERLLCIPEMLPNRDIKLKLGENVIHVGDEIIPMDTVIVLDKQKRIQAPLRFLAYAFGYAEDDVEWDQVTQTATIRRR